MTTGTIPAQVQARQSPTLKLGGHKVPPLTKKLFDIDTFWEREQSTSFQWGVTGHMCQPHSRSGHILGIVEKTNSMFCF